jgi:hypothetical protein
VGTSQVARTAGGCRSAPSPDHHCQVLPAYRLKDTGLYRNSVFYVGEQDS